MPPNPVFARLLSTVTFPLLLRTWNVGRHMLARRSIRHEKDLEIRVSSGTGDAAC